MIVKKIFIYLFLGFIMSNKLRMCFLTLFGSGRFPRASGTAGSFVALLLGLPILYFSNNTLFMCAVLIGVIAIKQIDIFETDGGKHDDKSIVIDELVGLWIALSFIPFSWIGIGCAFVFFRVFDIWKPSLVGYFDAKVKGGMGVVGDDALAGILAGLASGGVIRILEWIQGQAY